MASLRDVGQSLKEAREAQGQTLEEIATRTRITVRHLLALEEGNESDLPEVFYVRGFLKKYAESVGLSPKDVADAYRAAPIPTTTTPSMASSFGPIVYYLLIAGLIGGILALAWHFQPKQVVVTEPSPAPKASHRHTPKPIADAVSTAAVIATGAASPDAGASVATKPSQHPTAHPSAHPSVSVSPAASPKPSPAASVVSLPAASLKPSAKPASSPSPAAKASATPSGMITVGLTIVERSWLEVRVDGHGAYEGLLSPKSHKTFTGHVVMVSAGNAGGVKVALNGKAIGPLGPHGEVVAKTFKPSAPRDR